MSNHSQTAAAAMRREKSKSTKKPMALIFSDIQLPKLLNRLLHIGITGGANLN